MPNAPDRTAIKHALLECLALKALPRTGWVRKTVRNPESVAAHTWGVAWLVLALCPDGVDRGRALAIATVHDLAEVRVGDLTPHDPISKAEKARRELAAFKAIVAPFPNAAELLALYTEYAEANTPEGRFVKACDKLDMALQAQLYQDDTGYNLSEFIASALDRIDAPELRALITS